jgi:Uncharacterized protein conserved in cyanobacteria
MVQSLPKLTNFSEFIQWKPDNKRYELHERAIIEMPQPTGEHENIVGFLAEKLDLRICAPTSPLFYSENGTG